MQMSGGQDCLRCHYCKNIYFSAPDDSGIRYLDQLQDRQCPVCAIPLWNASLSRLGVQACKRCRGVLVPMGLLEDLIENMRADHPGVSFPSAPDYDGLSRRLRCPQCGRPMETHFHYGGGSAVVEDCEKCSVIWLEHDSLMRIVHAPHML
jgi:Zn-finger nucleic acid-binding protein